MLGILNAIVCILMWMWVVFNLIKHLHQLRHERNFWYLMALCKDKGLDVEHFIQWYEKKEVDYRPRFLRFRIFITPTKPFNSRKEYEVFLKPFVEPEPHLKLVK